MKASRERKVTGWIASNQCLRQREVLCLHHVQPVIKDNQTTPLSLHQPSPTLYLPLLFLPLLPLSICSGLSIQANRCNWKQLKVNRCSEPLWLTGLVKQVLRGEADTCLTARYGTLLLSLLTCSLAYGQGLFHLLTSKVWYMFNAAHMRRNFDVVQSNIYLWIDNKPSCAFKWIGLVLLSLYFSSKLLKQRQVLSLPWNAKKKTEPQFTKHNDKSPNIRLKSKGGKVWHTDSTCDFAFYIMSLVTFGVDSSN